MLTDKFSEIIKKRPAEFRGAPFWAWNDKLEPAELKRQVAVMHEMGFGQFFIHSRIGLGTEYLGREWFDAVRLSIAEAKKFGMKVWIYDEDRWPSGTAGGAVTRNLEFAGRSIDAQFLDHCDYASDAIAYFAVVRSGEELKCYRRLNSGDRLEESEEFLRIFTVMQEPSPVFNGSPYVDVLNPDAIDEFIRLTHDRYAAEIGDSFGSTVVGFFTDEPTFLDHLHKQCWTPRLPELFLQQFNYDLIERLPELLFETTESKNSIVRLHFYQLISRLFSENYAGKISAWCGAHNLKSTGHVLAEDDILSQTVTTGSVMRFYEKMDIPGIDVLSERWMLFDAAKQCASVARQTGCAMRLSEMYGCTGWDFPFEGYKAIGDWQAALGINFRCLHLAWYSMRGDAKRDYPASIFFQSPWYREFKTIEDYFARLSGAMSFGEEVRDILVLHPLESTWFFRPWTAYPKEKIFCEEGHFVNSGCDKRRELERMREIRQILLEEHLDFDYGDEEIIARRGHVSGHTLSIGQATYKVVVLPRMITIRSVTLALLAQFVKSGGQVFFLGAPPQYTDGIKSKQAQEAYADFSPFAISEVAKPVRVISITEAGNGEIKPVLYNLHRTSEFETLFVCNTSVVMPRHQHHADKIRKRMLRYPQVQISWHNSFAQGNLYEIDLFSDNICQLPFKRGNDGEVIFNTSFDRLQTRLFWFGNGQLDVSSNATKFKIAAMSAPCRATAGRLVQEWEVRLSEDNCLVLDQAAYSINGSEFSAEPEYVLDIAERFFPSSNLQPYRNTMPAETSKLKLGFNFCISESFSGPVKLAAEKLAGERFFLNGVEFDFAASGFFHDPALRTVTLPTHALRSGTNTLEVHCLAAKGLPSPEAMFLLGNFGVDAEEHIVKTVKRLRIGDWTSQGLRNYAGNVTYCMDEDIPPSGAMIEFDNWCGAALKISVNGQPPVVIAAPPYRANLPAGRCEIAVTVLGNLRNAFGPFHVKDPNLITPGMFRRHDVPERLLVPCGLLSAPVIVFRQK
ncbi:MAG: hypothetical protein PHI35_08435 [Victivallaceae bacterium]|nr:hypothetical protein [Victivallaceae bacterium]